MELLKETKEQIVSARETVRTKPPHWMEIFECKMQDALNKLEKIQHEINDFVKKVV